MLVVAGAVIGVRALTRGTNTSGSASTAGGSGQPGGRTGSGGGAGGSGTGGAATAPEPWTLVARLDGPTVAHAAPSANAGAVASVAPTHDGVTTSLPIVTVRSGWLEVRLGLPPPAPATGWIAPTAATVLRSPYRIEVDLGSRRLLLFRAGTRTVCTPVAVGTPQQPTPTGHFFVTLFAKPPSGQGGPFVVLTSAYVQAVTNWEQDGQSVITIQAPPGATAPASLTAATTPGSVWVDPSALSRLRPVPLGSPVDIETHGSASHTSCPAPSGPGHRS